MVSILMKASMAVIRREAIIKDKLTFIRSGLRKFLRMACLNLILLSVQVCKVSPVCKDDILNFSECFHKKAKLGKL